MADQKSFTGAEFIKALAEKTISEPVVLEGMAKLEDADNTSFMFSPGTSCASWTRIPADMVEQVVLIRVVTCKDHTHPFVRLRLKQPAADDPMASLLVAFVKQAASARQRPATLIEEGPGDEIDPCWVRVIAHCADGRFVESSEQFGNRGCYFPGQRARNEAYAMCNDRVLDYRYIVR